MPKKLAVLLIAALGLLIALSGCAAPPTAQPQAPAQPKVQKIRLTYSIDSLGFLPMYAARYNGYFGDEGLDVDYINTQGGGPDIAALMAGDADFNIGASTGLLAGAGAGQDLIGIFNVEAALDIQLLMNADAAKKEGITSDSPLEKRLAAMKGKKLGSSRPGAISWRSVAFYAERAGLKPGVDLEITGLGSLAAITAALEKGQIDVVPMVAPGTQKLLLEGKAILLIDPRQDPEFQPEFLYEVAITRKKTILERPDLVRKFVRALARGNQWSVEAPTEKIAEAMALYFPGITQDVMIEAVKHSKTLRSKTGEITKVGYEKALDFEIKTGGVKTPIKFEDVVDNQFIPKQ